MNFDIIVGNPPYQENVGNPNSNSSLAKQLYPIFMTMGISLQPTVYKFVPLQDFTSKSDINWNKSIHEIDLQLYKKI